MTVSEADLGEKPVGDNVVVCGGGLSGSECALGLAMQGRKVNVVDMLPREGALPGRGGLGHDWPCSSSWATTVSNESRVR